MTAHAVTRHEIFQTSLISALAQGVYEDEMTLAELLGHGSFGIGTFNGLDGEMIILGGVCYRLRGDGSVSVPELTERTPYAVVTNFVPSLSRSLTGPMTREEFSRAIDAFVPSSNYMYALRVTGRFAWASARTVTKQDRPYRPMIEATDGEEIARHEDFSGTIAGFRTPLYESGISVAGGPAPKARFAGAASSVSRPPMSLKLSGPPDAETAGVWDTGVCGGGRLSPRGAAANYPATRP